MIHVGNVELGPSRVLIHTPKAIGVNNDGIAFDVQVLGDPGSIG